MRALLIPVSMGVTIVAFTPPTTTCRRMVGRRHELSMSSDRMLDAKHYRTIEEGHIAVVPNFLPLAEVQALRTDAQNLFADQRFSTDALASYGTAGKFDPSKDRAVLRLSQWKDASLGDWQLRQRFGRRMAALRTDLAQQLQRPHLDEGLATTKYGYGSTEISYTRFGPGAFLRRHVDEHHEELKGRAGWSQPTRRSLSWLIYLNEPDWDGRVEGGRLRCFQRKYLPSRPVGALRGDLQIAWLRPPTTNTASQQQQEEEQPVYMTLNAVNSKSRLYYINNDTGQAVYLTKEFDSHPILYMTGGSTGGVGLVQKLLVDRPDLAKRLQFIEPPQSAGLSLFFPDGYQGQGLEAGTDEELLDVDATGGTLVVFDSVSLPHEVLATKRRSRWAASGWYHEDQQKPTTIHAS